MKKKSFLILLIPGIFFLTGCVSVTYVVRHAEKEPGSDPSLTPAGKARAVELAQLLKGQGVQEVYSTDFNRTRETARPTSDSLGLAVQLYGSDTLAAFVSRHLLPLGKKQLVVGHSNTIIPIVQALGASPSFSSIDDGDFDNLFIVRRQRFLNRITVTLTETTYGPPSP